MMWYVYILTSLKDGVHYVGSTNNTERRLWEHNNNHKTHSFTYKHRPFKISYTEQYSSKTEALKREKYFKTGRGREELKTLLVINTQ